MYVACVVCVVLCVVVCLGGRFLSTVLKPFNKDNEESSLIVSEKSGAMTPPPDPHLTYKYIYQGTDGTFRQREIASHTASRHPAAPWLLAACGCAVSDKLDGHPSRSSLMNDRFIIR